MLAERLQPRADLEVIQGRVTSGAREAVQAHFPGDEPKLVLVLTRLGNCVQYEVEGPLVSALWGRRDGPAPPDLFVWRGRVARLPPREFAVVRRCWQTGAVPKRELLAAVWGPGVRVKDGTLKSVVHRANTLLDHCGCPLMVAFNDQYVQLS